MKGFSRAATVAALLLPMAAGAPLAAQSWRFDLGVNGGGSWYSPLLGSDQINNTNGDVRFRAGWLVGAQAGLWLTPRIGIRANGTYTDRPLKQGNSFMGSDTELWHDVNLWSGTGDLMFRFKEPAATFTHMEALPYLALGLGAKWIAPAGGGAFVFNNTTASTTVNGIPINVAATGGTLFPAFFLPKQTRLMGLVGLGSDFRLARSLGLRLEVGDRIYKPRVFAMSAPATFSGTEDNVSKTVHEVYAQLGVHGLFGIASPPVVAVAPAPAPAPAPEPTPPPAPATQSVSVCTVNPATGLTTTTATFNPATGDTTVIINGNTMPIAQAYTSVPVASGQTWYVQGQPLVIGTGNGALNYVSFGSARNIEMNDLTYIGTVNGLPVFANRTDVASLTIPNPPVEISTNPTLVTGLRNVQVVYVPLTSYGCNFQPLQVQEQVRKVRR